MTDPQTVNKTATTADTVISISVKAVVAAAEALAIEEVPVLGLPGIKQIWESLFNWIAGKFVEAAQTQATFVIIDHQVDAEKTKLSQALANLIAAEKTGDPNAIKLAIKAYADANSALLHADGSATPTG